MKSLTIALAAALILSNTLAADAAAKKSSEATGGSVAEKCKALAKAQTKSRERQATLMTACISNGGKL